MQRELIHFFPIAKRAVSLPIGLPNGQLFVVIPFETIDDGAQVDFIKPTLLHGNKILRIQIKLNLDENSGSGQFNFFTILFKDLPTDLNLVQLRVLDPGSATIPKYSMGPMILVNQPSLVCTYEGDEIEFTRSVDNLANSEQELLQIKAARFGHVDSLELGEMDSCTIPPFP